MIRAWNVEVRIGEVDIDEPRRIYRAVVNATTREVALLLFVAELTRMSEQSALLAGIVKGEGKTR